MAVLNTMKNKTPSHTTQASLLASQASPIPLRFRFFMLLYGGLWHLLKPLLKRHRRLSHGFEQRLVPDNWVVSQQPRATKTIWLQAASGGEALIAESIIAALGQLAMPQQEDLHNTRHKDTLRTSDTCTSAIETSNIDTKDTSIRDTAVRAANNYEQKHLYEQTSNTFYKNLRSDSCIDKSNASHEQRQSEQPLNKHEQTSNTPCENLSSSHYAGKNNASQEQGQNEQPLIEVVCTTCTLQGLEVLNKAVANTTFPHLRIRPAYFPLDIPSLMQKALETIRPDAIVLLETELWPALLFSANQKGTPLLVVNGRMTEKSVSAYRFLRGFLSRFSPQWVMATSEKNAQRFQHIFPHALVEEIANCKFDIAQKLLEKKSIPDIPSPHSLVGETTNKPTVLLASVREEEEETLLQTVLSLVAKKDTETSPLVIIAPRHLHRVKAWVDMLTKHAIEPMLRSSVSSAKKGDTAQVIVWDTFGELSALYAYCDAIFVGGSFAPLGGQNFLEPLAFGKTPFVGPHLDNFLWIGKSILQEKLVVQLDTPEQLAPALLQAAKENTPQHRQVTQEHFSSWLLPRTGGSKAIAKKILDVVRRDF